MKSNRWRIRTPQGSIIDFRAYYANTEEVLNVLRRVARIKNPSEYRITRIPKRAYHESDGVIA